MSAHPISRSLPDDGPQDDGRSPLLESGWELELFEESALDAAGAPTRAPEGAPEAPVRTQHGDRERPRLSVVVPTRDEAGNVAELVRQLFAALGGTRTEVVFVDDSDDETPQAVLAAADVWGAARVRLIHRARGQRAGGLGGAVLEGLRAAAAPVAVVMDGDLQHPPAVVAELLAAMNSDPAPDLTVASRYEESGDAAGLANRWRTVVSLAFTYLARVFFPLRLRRVNDPMSGFFAVRMASVDLDRLRPNGYKILLEIIARSDRLTTARVPFSFQARLSGQSKASLSEGLRFVGQLLRLRWAASLRPVARVAGFLGVGLSGVVVNTAALALLDHQVRLPYLLASVIATHVALLWNFGWLDRAVFRSRPQGRLRRLARFWLLNLVLLPAQLGLLALLVGRLGMALEPANVIVLAGIFVLRYVGSASWVYGTPAAGTRAARSRIGARRPGAARTGNGTDESVQVPVRALPDLTIDLRPFDDIPAQDTLLRAGLPRVEDDAARGRTDPPLQDRPPADQEAPTGQDPSAEGEPAPLVSPDRVKWIVRGAVAAAAVAIAVDRPGVWLPFVAIFLTVGVARAAGWHGRELRIVVLAVGVVASSIDYLSWRASVVSWSWATVWIAIPLFLAEVHAAVHSAGLHVTLWPHRPAPLGQDVDPSLAPVFVFIPTVNEGTEILEPTLRAAIRARARYLDRFPHARVTIVVCNDGGVAGAECSPAVEELCRRLGVACVTRTVGGGAKAGNIENARQLVGGTGDALLVIFDADQTAHPDFLLSTVPPFADARVGWVQTGQYYCNRENPVARWADDQQALFYGLLCAGKANHDAAFICGTNVVLRAAALDEIGGLPMDSVTEDFAASILLAPRWRSVYLPERLATGLGPVDLQSYLRQQERWARGTLSVLRSHWRDLVLPRRGGLSTAQRFQYGLAVTHYLGGLRDLVFLVAPVIYLLTGISGVKGATLGAFLYHFVPYYGLTLLGFWNAARRITSWRVLVIGFGSFPALIKATWMTVAGNRGIFTITPKTRTSTSGWRSAWVHLAGLAVIVPTLVFAVVVRRSGAQWLSLAWLAYTCVMICAHLSLVGADRRAARNPAPSAARIPLDLEELLRAPQRRTVVLSRPEIAALTGQGRARWRRPRLGLTVAAVAALAAAGSGVLVLAPSQAATVEAAPTARAAVPLVGLSGLDADSADATDATLGLSPSVEGWTQELAAQFDATRASALRTRGATPWLTLALSRQGQAVLDASLTAVGNGVDDGPLTRWAQEIAAYGGPVYLTVLPAVDRDYAATSAVARGGIPQDAPRAWAHIRALFRAHGATNVAWVWSPASPATDAAFSPPESQIDAVALTLYEYPGTRWVDPGAALDALALRHPGKPVLVDVSTGGAARLRVAWLATLDRELTGRAGIAALTYHPEGPYIDPGDPRARVWHLDDPQVRRELRSAMADLVGAAQGVAK